MANYESELTGFLRTLKRSHPEIERLQKEGRDLWWDRNPDADEQRRWQESRVPMGGYVYYLNAPVKPAQGS